MTDNKVKYECKACDEGAEGGFNSRADWLFHLVLERHSKKARENMQTLYMEANGNLFVISELQEMDKALLLQHVAARVPSFSNFVCFRPQANLCIIACDEAELTKLSATSQVIDGVRPKFRAYNEIPPAEWKSYFTHHQTEVKKDPDCMKIADSTSSSTSAAFSNPTNSNSGKRNGGDDVLEQQEHGSKVPKLEFEDEDASGDPNQADTKLARWTDEIIQLNEFIMMPEAEINARMTAIDDLKKRLRSIYPTCELINVGGDFLGFNMDKDELRIFFDWQGLTNPQNTSNGTVHTVVETDQNVQKVIQRLFDLLRLSEEKGPIQSVKCDENELKVVYLLNGQVRLNCTLLLRPFKLVQTTLLCKQLFFMNPQSISLVKMVVYWAMKHGFADSGLHSYYSIYWLVYFFLIKIKIIGPVIELQKSCNYQIIDGEMNVAFSYDPSLLSQVAPRSSSAVAEDDIRIFLNWLIYIIETFGDVHGNGVNRRTSLACPRFGELIEKNKFRVARRRVVKTRIVRKISKQQLQQWTEDLNNIGFDKSTWPRIGKLGLPDTLTIQHPFYIDANVSLDFDGPLAKRFFAALRITKGNLTHFIKLPVNYDPHFSLLDTLDKEKLRKCIQKRKGTISINEEPCGFTEDDEVQTPRECNDSNSDPKEDEAGDSEAANAEIRDINFSLPSLHSSYLANWTNEINTMFESITLSDDERTIRIAVIEELETILRPLFRFCVLIPVGADFLGFKTVEQVFDIYLDSRGINNPENQSKKRTIDESYDVIRRVQQHVIAKLNDSPSVLEVSTDGVSVKFVFVLRGQGQLRCNMLLRPFKSAGTALLCKQLFRTNPQTTNLVIMIMYWVGKRKDFADCFLVHPFLLLWLVYFFLIKKNILPPVLELQKACDYEIEDKPFSNVAFSYDPTILNPSYQRFVPSVSADNLISNVELLVECFIFIDKFDNPAEGARNIRRHSVISPRVGELIDKAEFKVCKESLRKPKIFGKRGRELRKGWTQNLFSLGFDSYMWEMLALQRLRDDFVIQHPFYFSDNICCEVSGPESRAFFTAIKQTKEKLMKLAEVVGTQLNVSLIDVLSS